MKGDFTRWTFDPQKRFSQVLMQQGRVQLDADWNEQTSILLHYLRTLAAHIIGRACAVGAGRHATMIQSFGPEAQRGGRRGLVDTGALD